MRPDDAALDALAVALAPRLLREIRSLLAEEADPERALGIAALAEMGYEPGPRPDGSYDFPPAATSRKRTRGKSKR